MIVPGVRRSVLGQFPRGTPLLIAASDPHDFLGLASELADPAIVVTALSSDATPHHPVLATIPHLLLDGIDDLEDVTALLAALHGAARVARLFALVSNAAHVRGLGAFAAGTSFARAHPLVRAELEALFSTAGWPPLAITPIYDPTLAAPAAFPADVSTAGFTLRVDDREAFERVGTAAFIVVADRQ